MIRKNHIHRQILYLLAGLVLFSCERIEDTDKYKRPEWLAGKLYDQILEREELSSFAEAIRITGYDTIVNKSGSYTIFAPTNEAFDLFFGEYSQFNGDLEKVPYDQLLKIVKYHIIQNPWNKSQLQDLNPNGWVTDDDHPINSKPWAYKRQTLLNDDNEKYYYKSDKGEYTITDSLESSKYRIVYGGKRKFAPIYFDAYFSLNNLKYDDYAFYFDRTYEPGNLFYANALVGDEIFAENGFIYPVDRVAEPAMNGKQLLEKGINGSSYKEFLSLIYQFPEFSFNRDATFDQSDAAAGGQFDSLFNLNYANILFNIHDEEYRGGYAQSTQKHYGLLAPDDQAFQDFLKNTVTAESGYPHWANFNVVPEEVKKIIVNAHMSEYPVYRTNLEEGFYNGLDDRITVNGANIEHRYFGSNCSFLGLSEAVMPRAFSSVTAPVYLRPGYSMFMRAMEFTRVLPAIKRGGTNYAFYVVSDNTIALDSSLILNWIDQNRNAYNFRAYDRTEEKTIAMNRNDLSKRILNQVGLSEPTGAGRKEFIENLAGNYIVVNNIENEVSGSEVNVFGYMGDSMVVSNPVELAEPTDNGTTYEVAAWFNYSKSELFSIISSYSGFYSLLIKAGLIDVKNYTFNFINEGDIYTVLVPTNEALTNAGADTLNLSDLKNFLLYHFIRDNLIFTDGKKPAGYYETTRMDESSTEFTVKYSKLHLSPGVDHIDILDSSGNLYYSIEEDEDKTNMMGVSSTGDAVSYWDFITTAVVHEIDTVLIR